MTTKLFLDTEFTGLHQNTTLISLALVADTGEEFYAEFTDYDQNQVDPWIKEHVVDQLILVNRPSCTDVSDLVGNHRLRGNSVFIKESLQGWLTRFTSCELWSDVLSYDWVLFCQLFGGAFNLPKNVFYIAFDLATVFKVVCIDPDVSREEFADLQDDLPQHNALHDARVQLACYQKLAAVSKLIMIDL